MNITYFFIFCVLPILLLNLLSIKSQKKFLKRYKEKINTKDFEGPIEYVDHYRHKSLDQIGDAAGVFRTRFQFFLGQNYHDSELNSLALKIRLYYLAQALVIILTFLSLGYLISNS